MRTRDECRWQWPTRHLRYVLEMQKQSNIPEFFYVFGPTSAVPRPHCEPMVCGVHA